jgi:hypothetical protein
VLATLSVLTALLLVPGAGLLANRRRIHWRSSLIAIGAWLVSAVVVACSLLPAFFSCEDGCIDTQPWPWSAALPLGIVGFLASTASMLFVISRRELAAKTAVVAYGMALAAILAVSIPNVVDVMLAVLTLCPFAMGLGVASVNLMPPGEPD